MSLVRGAGGLGYLRAGEEGGGRDEGQPEGCGHFGDVFVVFVVLFSLRSSESQCEVSKLLDCGDPEMSPISNVIFLFDKDTFIFIL